MPPGYGLTGHGYQDVGARELAPPGGMPAGQPFRTGPEPPVPGGLGMAGGPPSTDPHDQGHLGAMLGGRGLGDPMMRGASVKPGGQGNEDLMALLMRMR